MKLYFFQSLLIFTINLTYSQTWDYKIFNDNVYELRDRWGDSQKYLAKFYVYNDSISYYYETKGEKDNWIQVAFPKDFKLIKNPDQITYPQKFIIKAEVLRETVFTDTITYYPGPKGKLQLFPTEIPIELNSYFINEKPLDAYHWEDSLGMNYFIRTTSHTDYSSHIYFYHFTKNKTYTLKRKHVDYVNNCESNSNVNHVIESIQITDLNEDNIAEVSCVYNVGCHEKQTKIFMLTEGKKYLIRGDQNLQKGYKTGRELTKEPEFLRFLQNKWDNEINK